MSENELYKKVITIVDLERNKIVCCNVDIVIKQMQRVFLTRECINAIFCIDENDHLIIYLKNVFNL